MKTDEELLKKKLDELKKSSGETIKVIFKQLQAVDLCDEKKRKEQDD